MNGITRQWASIRFRAGISGEPILQEAAASDAYEFRPARWGAALRGSPAPLVPGDQYGLKVEIGVGCCAEIRSQSPSVAGPALGANRSAGPGTSSVDVSVLVASDAMLTWRPEPGVAGPGCSHRQDSSVELAASARLLWRDEVVLGAAGDGPSGTWSSRLRVARDGWPVVCSEVALGPGSPLWESPAVLNRARAISVMVVVDPSQSGEGWCPARARERSATGVALPLAGPGVQLAAWGDDPADCRLVLEKMVPACGTPAWALERWSSGRTLDAVG